jgi:hypothetical protein
LILSETTPTGLQLLAVEHALLVRPAAEVDVLRPTDIACQFQDVPVGLGWGQHVPAARTKIQPEDTAHRLLALALGTELALLIDVHSNIIIKGTINKSTSVDQNKQTSQWPRNN